MMRIFLSKAEWREREALSWVQVLHGETVSEAQMDAYVAWMEADSRNAEIFRQLDDAWITADANAEAIRARFGPEACADRASWLYRAFRPGWTPQFAAVLGAIIVAGVFVLNQPLDAPPTLQKFTTAIGERREVTLVDSSTVILNTGSQITVNLAADKREVMLASGGALFDVTPDADRPFVVRMDGGAVEVLGTVFDVLRKSEGFAVTVLEGRVSVSPDIDGPVPNKAVVLTPNQGAEVNTQQASLTSFTVDADVATAWRYGQLIYRDASLQAVMADIARYSPVPLTLSPDVGEPRFTGVLTIESPSRMLDRLASLLQLDVISAEDGSLRIQPIE